MASLPPASPFFSPVPEFAEHLPRTLGSRYVLLKVLARGGMGRVYLALGDDSDGGLCAIKTLVGRERERDTHELDQRFLDEGRLAIRLRCDHLVRVFDAGVLDSERYLAMEFIDGQPLSALLTRCRARSVRMPLGLAMYVTHQLATGLAYVHAFEGLDLVHRDVAPTNVMLSYGGTVKLIDFGLAKWSLRGHQTAVGIRWGQAGYVSPEQQIGAPVDARSDLFSAGVLLWEMLAGRALFPAGEPRPDLGTLLPPSHHNPLVPPELDRITLRALAPEANGRFASAQALAAALANHLAPVAHAENLSQFLRGLFREDRETDSYEQVRLAAEGQSFRAVAAVAPAPRLPLARPEGPDPLAPLSLVGQVLGHRYEVKRLLASGAMASVYEAIHRGIGKRVAIKIPHREEQDREGRARFHLEAHAVSQIGNVHVVDVTDSGTTAAGEVYFVMSYLDGIDLQRLVDRDGSLPADRAIIVAAQICTGVAAAHAAGIVHRDLKPSNVMLVPSDETADFVKVLDFGVAKLMQAAAPADPGLTRPDSLVGTPLYMAPEQMMLGGTVDARSDVYAIGGILFFLLCGRPPFDDHDPQVLCRRKLAESPPSARALQPDVPEELDKLLSRALARTPERRPASAIELQDKLWSMVDRRRISRAIVEARLSSTTALVQASPRPRGRVALAGAGALLLASGGLATGLAIHRPGRRAADHGQVQASNGASSVGRPQPVTPLPMTKAVPALPSVAPALPSVARALPSVARALPSVARALPSVASGESQPSLPKPASVSATLRSGPRVVASPSPAPPDGPVRTSFHPRVTRLSTPAFVPPVGTSVPLAPIAAVPARPRTSAELVEQGERAFQLGRLVEALMLARQAVAAGAGSAGDLLAGKCYLRLAEPEQAQAAFRRALAADPSSAAGRRGLAEAEAALATGSAP